MSSKFEQQDSYHNEPVRRDSSNPNTQFMCMGIPYIAIHSAEATGLGLW